MKERGFGEETNIHLLNLGKKRGKQTFLVKSPIHGKCDLEF